MRNYEVRNYKVLEYQRSMGRIEAQKAQCVSPTNEKRVDRIHGQTFRASVLAHALRALVGAVRKISVRRL